MFSGSGREEGRCLGFRFVYDLFLMVLFIYFVFFDIFFIFYYIIVMDFFILIDGIEYLD